MSAQPWDHWSAMVSAAAPVVGRDDAPDCAAEALAQYLEHHPDDVRNLEALLVSITKRRAVDQVRAAIRARRRDSRLAAQVSLAAPDVAEEIARRAEARWVDAEARRLLSAQDYELLLLVADGLPMQAVAARLGLSQRKAFYQLAEARRVVREALGEALAKGLTVLGLVAGAVRKWLTPAAATSAVLAAAVVLSIAATPAGPTSPELRVGPETFPLHEKADPEPAPTLKRVAEARPEPTRASATRRTAPPEKVAGVQTSLVGARLERRDDGRTSSGPVEQLTNCIENLRVEPHYLGC